MDEKTLKSTQFKKKFRPHSCTNYNVISYTQYTMDNMVGRWVGDVVMPLSPIVMRMVNENAKAATMGVWFGSLGFGGGGCHIKMIYDSHAQSSMV